MSDYEARAYLTLIRHGSLLTSELAYHSGIPRTKAYATVRSLVRKKLAALLPGRPIRCQAVPPEEGFEGLVAEEEKRLRSMRRTMSRLRRLMIQARSPAEAQEGRHLILGAQATISRLAELISSARDNVRCVVDSWGFKLLQDSKEHLLVALANEVRVQVVVAWRFDMQELDRAVPSDVEIRFCRHRLGQSVFSVDDASVLLVNSSSGQGLLIHSQELAGLIYSSLFQGLWNQSIPAKDVASVVKFSGAEDVFDILGKKEVAELFLEAVAQSVPDDVALARIGVNFVGRLEERLHVNLFREPIEIALPLLNTLMAQSLGEGASVRFDPVTRLLTVEVTHSESVLPASVWIFAIAGLSMRNGVSFKILQNVSHPTERSQILQAKLSRVLAAA